MGVGHDPDRYRPQRNWGPRVRRGAWHGLRTVTLENKRLRVTVLADKGTDVVELLDKRRDLDFAWLTAGGVRDPRVVLADTPDPGLAFTDVYPGGWQEIFPSGGTPSAYHGAAFGQHGEVSTLPWDDRIVEDGEAAVAVRFTVRTTRTPFRIAKTLRLVAGEPVLHVAEAVTNESDVPLRAMWGHHLAFGRPFLHPGCRVVLPDGLRVTPHPTPTDAVSGRRRVDPAGGTWPRVPAAVGGTVDLGVVPERGTPSELVYLTGFGAEGWYAVESDRHGAGFRLSWDATVLPHLWFWQEFGATAGYPWYGRHHNIGLEPFSSYPSGGLADAVANGTALALGPREERALWLRAEVYDLGGHRSGGR